MGKRGPAPKPTALHAANGSWVAGTRNDQHVTVCDTVPPVPAHFGGHAAKVWNHYGPMLVNQGVIAESDLLALEAMSMAYENWRDAAQLTADMGADYEDENGWHEYPHAKRAERWWDRFMKASKEFGMTPANRPSVPRSSVKEKSIGELYG